MDADFIGKQALAEIKRQGVQRMQVGLEIDGPPLAAPNTVRWPVTSAAEQVGHVTSAIHSPRLARNIALAMVATDHSAVGTTVDVVTSSATLTARVVPKPFYDPKKRLAATAV